VGRTRPCLTGAPGLEIVVGFELELVLAHFLRSVFP
jgi:hypothetical protein